jgi:hypothetical protein
MLGYLKLSPYIIYLQINDNDVVRNLFKDDININTSLLVKRVKVIKIEHIATKEIINEIKRVMMNGSTQKFIVNCWFDKNIMIFQTYERAFFEDFMKYGQHKLFENGYSGPCLTYYHNGQIEYEGHINNGQVYGLCRRYFQNGEIKLEGTIINGKKNGEFKMFTQKPKYRLKIHHEYVDGIIVKDYLLQ